MIHSKKKKTDAEKAASDRDKIRVKIYYEFFI